MMGRSEEDKPMSDPLKATPSQATSKPISDCTMLDRTIFRPSPEVQAASIEGETVLLDLSTGRYYTLNHLGSVIWEHCARQSTIRDIHADLCNRFEVAPEQALNDLVALIDQLIQEGLLQQERK
jgi:hypothetical protein